MNPTKTNEAAILEHHHDVSAFLNEKRHTTAFAHYNNEAKAMEATNNQVAVRVPVRTIPIEGKSIASCLVDPVSMRRIGRSKSPALLSVEGETVMLEAGAMAINATCPAEISQTFPNLDTLFAESTPKFSITINADTLKRIADYALKYGNQPNVRLDFVDNLSNARFTIELKDDERAIGVFVPSRMI